MLAKAFSHFASAASRWAGSPVAFVAAAAVILIWAIAGPVFGFSDVWQLTINTGTTIVTFLIVFLIQNSQNRDTKALQIKMDELIRATKGASNTLIDLENMTEAEIDHLHERYSRLAVHAKELGVDLDWEKDEEGRPASAPQVRSVARHHPPKDKLKAP
ncbi:MAG: low affinity iron permease family protein [Rhizobiales bacterium]|nr:low affinity iron permease family protein [Hyphomicrobiales bacterium]